MKAIVQDGYGSTDVYRYTDIEKPTPGDNEVLVKVRATSIHPDVWHVMRGWPLPLRLMGSGLRRPKHKVPGTDLAGTVAAVGKDVTGFKRGDEVFGETVTGENLWRNGGSFAEYATVATERLAHKPPSVTFVQAAAVPTTAVIAMQATHGTAKVKPGQLVLVNGAGGGVGSLVVQMAKMMGATVTAVDSADKLAMLSDVGADRVIDYAIEDFTATGDRYDLIVDIPGNHSLKEIKCALTPEGKYLLIGHDDYGHSGGYLLGSFGKMLTLMARTPFTRQLPKLDFNPLGDVDDPMTEIATMLANGQLVPIVDRTFPLSKVPQAMQYLTDGHARGKVVITI